MESDPIFDSVEAMERVDQDKALLKELFEMFFADWSSNVANITKSIGSGDLLAAARDAHAVKSALGNLGAMQAYRCAQRIELAAKNANIAALQEEAARLPALGEAFRKAGLAFFST